jgi:hypothetical protein
MAEHTLSPRAITEQKIIAFMNDVDPSGFNSSWYKAHFKTLSDREFDLMMKQIVEETDYNLFVELNMQDEKTLPDLDKIEALAAKYKIPLTEKVAFPHKVDENNPAARVPVTPTPTAIFYIQIMRLQQLLDKKSNASARIDSVNTLTGQVTGSAKAASINDTQTMSLVTTGQYKSIKELLGPRADDKLAKAKMLDLIERNGDVDMDEIETSTQNKQSVQTTTAYLMAAGLDVKFGNSAKRGTGGKPTEKRSV